MPNLFSTRYLSMFAAMLLMLGFAGTAAACPGKSCADGKCKYKSNNIIKQLGLEGERAAEVEALQKDYRADKQAVREQMHEQVRLLNEDYKAGLMRVLTPEEYEKVEAYLERPKMRYKHKQYKKCTDKTCKNGECKHAAKDGSPRHCKTKDKTV